MWPTTILLSLNTALAGEIFIKLESQNHPKQNFDSFFASILEGTRFNTKSNASEKKLNTSSAQPIIKQQEKKFMPEAVALMAGQEVDFQNKDDIFHNVFSLDPLAKFDLGLYKGQMKYSENGKYPLEGQFRTRVPFKKAGKIRVFCNIHKDMMATIYVYDHPFYAKANQDGIVRLPIPNTQGKMNVVIESDFLSQPYKYQITLPIQGNDLKRPLVINLLTETNFAPIEHTKKDGQTYKVKDQGTNQGEANDFY